MTIRVEVAFKRRPTVNVIKERGYVYKERIVRRHSAEIRAGRHIDWYVKRQHDYLHYLPPRHAVIRPERAIRVTGDSTVTVQPENVFVEVVTGVHIDEVHR